MKTQQNRIYVLLSSIVMQLVLGVIYIWGVFQPHIVNTFGWNNSTASLTFSFVLAFFVVGGIVGGRFQDKYSPRIVVIVSGILIGVGTFLASYTKQSNPYYMYGTYGILAGSGIGAIYTTTIATTQKWFPDKKAFASGLVVSALGFGGVVFTPIANYLLSTYGVSKTFVIFAFIFSTITLIGSIFISNPPKDYCPKGYKADILVSTQKQYTSGQMLKTSTFYILTLTMLLSLPAFFMISPLIKVIGSQRGMTDSFATSVVMISAILNSSGRFIAPLIAQKVGNKLTIVILNLITICGCLLLMVSNGLMTAVLISVIALAFGGFLGIFPALTSSYFGIKYAGANYGLVLTGYGLAAIFAPKIYEFSLNFSNGAPFIAVSILSLVAVIVALSIKAPSFKKENLDAKKVVLSK